SQATLKQDLKDSAAAIPAVTAKWCVDPNRIYATGNSNGGSLSEVIAAREYAPLAAIAPNAAGVSATVFRQIGCPKAPSPGMERHASGDDLFPLSAGYGADVAKEWAKCDGCDLTPSAPTPDGCTGYTGCASGVEVKYCQDTGPHGAWPARNPAIFDFF